MALVKKHLLTICAIISLLALLLPFVTETISVSVWGYSEETSNSSIGLEVMWLSLLGYMLLIGPVVLIAMNYVPALAKYKGILAIVIPILCIIGLIAVYASCGDVANSVSDVYDYDISSGMIVEPAIGIWVAALSYIATIVAGAVTYHNYTLDKAGLAKLKADGAALAKNLQEKAENAAETAKAAQAKAAESADKADTPDNASSAAETEKENE